MSKMKKSQEIEIVDSVKVKVIRVSKGDGAYGLTVYEIPESVLLNNSEVVEKPDPDVYAVFVNHMNRITRGIFGF